VGLGLGYWATNVADLFMTAQSFSSLGIAYVLANHNDVVRVDPQVPRGRFGLDVYRETESLKGLGASEARKALPTVQSMFINEGPAERFEPYKDVGRS
jgi:uncharacterized protein